MSFGRPIKYEKIKSSLKKGGKDMPCKIGGGNKMEEYDPATGRYCGAACGYSNSYLKSLTILSRYPTLNIERKTSKVMPNYKNAITPDEKFVDYSLNENHPIGRNKAIVYKAVLGYTKENYSTLREQIHSAVISGTAKLIDVKKNPFDVIEYNYIIRVTGPNGNSADVIAKYGVKKKAGKPQMITNYIKRRH